MCGEAAALHDTGKTTVPRVSPTAGSLLALSAPTSDVSVTIVNGVRVASGLVKTSHTGTWVGTAGSTQAGSKGQIAFTLIIAANGNALSGTGSIEVQDTSYWAMSGTETGRKVVGTIKLIDSNSSCATDAKFDGTFSADTLGGTFVEMSPPTGCGSAESGTFRVVKQ